MRIVSVCQKIFFTAQPTRSFALPRLPENCHVFAYKFEDVGKPSTLALESVEQEQPSDESTNAFCATPVKKRDIKRMTKIDEKQAATVVGATPKNGCKRCLKANPKLQKVGCDVGSKAIFRSMRNLSNTEVEKLRNAHGTQGLKDALVDYLMSNENLTRVDAEPVATLMLVFAAVHHADVEHCRNMNPCLATQAELIKLVQKACYQWSWKVQDALTNRPDFKTFLSLSFMQKEKILATMTPNVLACR